MIINSLKSFKNYILLRKGGDKLYKAYSQIYNDPSAEEVSKTCYNSNNNNTNYSIKTRNNTKSKSTQKTDFYTKSNFSNFNNNLIKSTLSLTKDSSVPKKTILIKKNIFMKTKLKDNKKFLVEDFIRSTELSKESTKCKHRRLVSYEIDRNSYITNYWRFLRDKTIKYPVLKKDVESSLIFYNNEKIRTFYQNRNTSYFDKERTKEIDNNEDLNNKIGPKHVYIKTQNIIGLTNKKKVIKFDGDNRYFKSFYFPFNNNNLNNNRRKTKLCIGLK